jgi:hypothetical protein
MSAAPTLMLIADIGGYTRFMKLHRTSVVHAHDIVARLLEAVIDAAAPAFRLAKLEGDAAFLYMPAPRDGAFDPGVVAGHAVGIHRAFHERASELALNTVCPCDGCQQAGNLRIKLVGHVGGVAMQKVKRLTELAGVDVIVVHRMLKNAVPVPEYLLVTEPAYAVLDPRLRERAAAFDLDLDDIGATPAYYVDLAACADQPAAPRRLSPLARLRRHLGLSWRTLPHMLGVREPCAGFRNLPP